MKVDKRYTERQAVRLLSRLTTIGDIPVDRARRLFAELLSARLDDVVVGAAEQTVAAAPDTAIAGLQAGVYAFFHLALGAEQAPAARRWPDMTVKGVTLTMSGPDDLRLEVSGALNTMLTLQVYSLLRRVGDRLRQCECGQLYVRVRRQTSCSERCQKRFYMRRFRAGEAGRE